MDIAIIFVTPILLLVFGALVIWLRRLALVEDVGFALPSARAAIAWLAGFIVLAVAVEYLSHAFGLDDPSGEWRGKYDAANLAIRIAAIALIYPITEEFFFRGALLGVLRKRFGDMVGIVGSSAVFALIHIQYDWRGMAFVLVDALFFAVCRVRTGSLFLVMAMHIIGNSFAVWQRLYG